MAEAIRGFQGLQIQELVPEDNVEIDSQIIEFVSRRLHKDWKKFAVEKISDDDIEHIDLDKREAYEKAHAMLNKWKQTNKIKVTKGMLKLTLRDIERNDILYDLKEGKNNSSDERAHYIPQGVAPPVRSEIIVRDLRLKDINKLTSKLDPSFGSGINNWLPLAHKIIGKDPELVPQIRDLELHYCGGGNPASRFLEALSTRHPELTVGRFQATAQELNRNDIYVFIEEHLQGEKHKRLSKIHFKNKEHLTSLLNTNIPGINSWDMFADEYGYTYNEISVMKAAIKEERSYSPSERLFQLLRESKPTLKLSEIREACRQLARNDVVYILNEIEREIKELRN